MSAPEEIELIAVGLWHSLNDVVRCFKEEVAQGDGFSEEHAPVVESAMHALRETTLSIRPHHWVPVAKLTALRAQRDALRAALEQVHAAAQPARRLHAQQIHEIAEIAAKALEKPTTTGAEV